jgi:hypothetical protein
MHFGTKNYLKSNRYVGDKTQSLSEDSIPLSLFTAFGNASQFEILKYLFIYY